LLLQLDVLDKHEQETILSSFNADVAFELGSLIRQRCLEYSQPVTINITLANQQVFFHALSRPGTNLDNQHWIQRKQRTVLRFGRSSFYMGTKLRKQGRTIETAFQIRDYEQYSVHGGGFPIRVRGTEGVVGVIAVSGLRQDLDHLVIYEALKSYIAANQPAPSTAAGITKGLNDTAI
jgi:uncharacterized protein (UPF0303 family)